MWNPPLLLLGCSATFSLLPHWQDLSKKRETDISNPCQGQTSLMNPWLFQEERIRATCWRKPTVMLPWSLPHPSLSNRKLAAGVPPKPFLASWECWCLISLQRSRHSPICSTSVLSIPSSISRFTKSEKALPQRPQHLWGQYKAS